MIQYNIDDLISIHTTTKVLFIFIHIFKYTSHERALIRVNKTNKKYWKNEVAGVKGTDTINQTIYTTALK